MEKIESKVRFILCGDCPSVEGCEGICLEHTQKKVQKLCALFEPEPEPELVLHQCHMCWHVGNCPDLQLCPKFIPIELANKLVTKAKPQDADLREKTDRDYELYLEIYHWLETFWAEHHWEFPIGPLTTYLCNKLGAAGWISPESAMKLRVALARRTGELTRLEQPESNEGRLLTPEVKPQFALAIQYGHETEETLKAKEFQREADMREFADYHLCPKVEWPVLESPLSQTHLTYCSAWEAGVKAQRDADMQRCPACHKEE